MVKIIKRLVDDNGGEHIEVFKTYPSSAHSSVSEAISFANKLNYRLKRMGNNIEDYYVEETFI